MNNGLIKAGKSKIKSETLFQAIYVRRQNFEELPVQSGRIVIGLYGA